MENLEAKIKNKNTEEKIEQWTENHRVANAIYDAPIEEIKNRMVTLKRDREKKDNDAEREKRKTQRRSKEERRILEIQMEMKKKKRGRKTKKRKNIVYKMIVNFQKRSYLS